MPRRSSISIRDATPDDLEAIIALLAQLHPDYPADRSTAGEILATMLRQPGRSVLVAQASEEVIGTADLLIVANLTHHSRPWAIVENLVVDETARGTGVGRALIEEVVSRADQAGCYMIQLLSLKHRTEAHAFYERNGFEPVAYGLRRYLRGYVATGP